MRILHLVTSGELGGAETSLVDLIEAVREAEPGWQTRVIAPAAGHLVDHLRAIGVEADVLAFPGTLARVGESSDGGIPYARSAAAVFAALAYRTRLRAWIRRSQATIVHAHGFKMHILSALAHVEGVPVVWHVHGYVSGRPWTIRALKRLAGRVRVAIANSRSVSDDLRAILGDQVVIRTVYNGIDLRRFSPEGPKADLDAAAGLPPAAPGTVRVGLLGALGRWKGHGVFLDALARAGANLPLRGYIIGAPIYATRGSQLTIGELRAAAAAKGLNGRVGFTGFLRDVPAALRALDIVVHSSTEPEPFGMVIAEAMACGRATVVSRAGGAVELFVEGRDALAHTPGSVEELAQALVALTVDAALRRRIGRAGRIRAERCFDRRAIAASIVPLYRELAAAW